MVGSAAHHFKSIEALDRALAGLSWKGGALRFQLGVGLEALGRSGGHHELGFSSVEAYALERCERSARWVQVSRSLARRLEELPAIRDALVVGDIGFSMAELRAKVARAEDETA